MASVIGKDVSFSLLQAVAGLSETVLDQHLQHLQAGEFLHELRRVPDRMYTFRHALTQDVAYQSLLKSTRQQYHRQIAEVLEERFSEIVEAQPERLAYHFTEAQRHEQAVNYWYQAGQRASERSAHREAISHFTKGLEVLDLLTDTQERAQRELTLLVALSAPLMVTKGWTSPQVEQTFNRARVLCQQVGDIPQQFYAIRGLWRFYQIGGDLRTANELAKQCLSLAERQQDRAILIEAHLVMGITLYYIGDMRPAHEHFMRGFALYNPAEHHELAYLYGEDPGVACLTRAANMLWLLGYPDQALVRNQAAIELARELTHPFSPGYAFNFALILHRFRRQWHTLQEQAEISISPATEHGFVTWVNNANLHRGLALSMQGHSVPGIVQIRQGIAGFQSLRAGLGRPDKLLGLAEVLGRTGQVEEGLSLLDKALALMDTGERYYEAEIHRHKGELLLLMSKDNTAEAETCFNQALSVAHRQQAKSWELRAATSLARLWQSQGKRQDAHDQAGTCL